jgi:hypothetical protein
VTSEGSPGQQGESTANTLLVRGEDSVRASETVQAEVITYPQQLLNLARKLIDDGQFSIAAVVCHMACEIATERVLSPSFTKKGCQDLKEPVLALFSGYSLSNSRLRELYTALTGDEIQKQSFWEEFLELAKRRNSIVHGQLIIAKEDAEKSLKVAHDFIAYLKASEDQRDITTPLYDTDFYAWTQAQAAALRAKDFASLDLEHVAEELESVGMDEKHAITRQLQRLLHHLLKWQYQPTHRTRSWQVSIDQARDRIGDVIERSHSLQTYPAQRLALAYGRARRDAITVTRMPASTFPEVCPWPLADVLTEGWLPPEGEENRP